MKQLSKSFFERDALVVARELLGKIIEFNGTSGMIVETEAYKADPASHGYKITPRSEIMLSTYAHVYVYIIYGMYHCINFTTNRGEVGAVLIRALEPLKGIDKMKRRRKTSNVHNLMSGPGKVCGAMNITKKQNYTKINDKIKVYDYISFKDSEISKSGRIGISQGKDLDWRFFVKGNKFVSRV
jgi:DNA-3-methyladenine glycosylase